MSYISDKIDFFIIQRQGNKEVLLHDLYVRVTMKLMHLCNQLRKFNEPKVLIKKIETNFILCYSSL